MKKFNLTLIICLMMGINLFSQDITPLGTMPNIAVKIVDVTTPWTNTSCDLIAGNDYVIIVNGIAATNKGTTPSTRLWEGPEGIGDKNWTTTDFPLPSASAFSVIGKIGTSGQPFYVGRNCPFTANVSGRLYLGYNDKDFWDNFGYYVAFIFYKPTPPLNAVEDTHSTIVNDYNISQNYPNPFNPTTLINFDISNSSDVKITIYDINGQTIRELLNEYKNSGSYVISWDGKDNYGNLVSSGTYYYQLNVGNVTQSKKMILLK